MGWAAGGKGAKAGGASTAVQKTILKTAAAPGKAGIKATPKATPKASPAGKGFQKATPKAVAKPVNITPISPANKSWGKAAPAATQSWGKSAKGVDSKGKDSKGKDSKGKDSKGKGWGKDSWSKNGDASGKSKGKGKEKGKGKGKKGPGSGSLDIDHPMWASKLAEENRIESDGVPYTGTISLWNFKHGWGFVQPDDPESLPEDVQAKLAEAAEVSKAQGKNLASESLIYFRKPDVTEGYTPEKDAPVSFQIYTDDKGVGAFEVTG